MVELFEKLIGGIRCTVNDWVIIIEVNCHGFTFEKLLKVFPVVHFLVQLEAVVILIHLDLFRVVPIGLENSTLLTWTVFLRTTSRC